MSKSISCGYIELTTRYFVIQIHVHCLTIKDFWIGKGRIIEIRPFCIPTAFFPACPRRATSLCKFALAAKLLLLAPTPTLFRLPSLQNSFCPFSPPKPLSFHQNPLFFCLPSFPSAQNKKNSPNGCGKFSFMVYYMAVRRTIYHTA